MTDALRRAARTFLQSFLGTLLLSFPATALGVLPSPEFFARVVTVAAFAGAVAVLSLVQNGLEDNTKFPNMLKPDAYNKPS